MSLQHEESVAIRYLRHVDTGANQRYHLALNGVTVEESQLSGAVLEALRASARVESMADSGTQR